MVPACIVVDWGTSNRRAWALRADGVALADRADSAGVLAVRDRGFARSLQAFLADWLAAGSGAPILISGMAGSRLGWVEAPYLAAPVSLADLARALVKAGGIAQSECWIVPGISLDDTEQPEVMRGEESQILGALLLRQRHDGYFVLPGTHSKWARVSQRSLVEFHTYMTGELFGLLRQSGTLAQLMAHDAWDEGAFARGVRATGDGAELLNRLFSARSLALFDRLQGREIASYLSGLLIATEMRDALAGWPDLARAGATCIGASAMLARYAGCAALLGLELQLIDSKDVLPAALLWIARRAGLVPA